jgi:hypothetical protein
MSSRKNRIRQRIRLTGAFAALATLALAVSCRGFFVNPTLNSIAIGPQTLSLTPEQVFQMQAVGTYSDGSTADVTGKASWTSSDPSAAAFSATVPGQITGASLANIPSPPATTTVTAAVGAISSGASATVTVCPLVVTLVTTASPSTEPAGGTITFDVKATFQGVTGTTDVTGQVTWNIGDTSVISSIDSDGNGVASATGTTTVSATLCGATSAAVTVTVD